MTGVVTTTTTKPITPNPIIITPVEEETTETPDTTCFVCGGVHYTECGNCEKIICKEHTRQVRSFCQVTYTFCPLCHAKKESGVL